LHPYFLGKTDNSYICKKNSVIQVTELKNNMVEYSLNQTGSIATLLSSAVSSSTLLGIILMGVSPAAETTFFGVLTFVFWVLVPLYWLRIRMSYLVGLLFCVVALIGGVGVIPGVEPIWLVVPGTMFTFSLGLIWIINLACAYFSFRAFQGN
jgi:hypothetical protein